MREVIERVLVAVGGSQRRVERRRWEDAPPHRRRPRKARTTYVPVRPDALPMRLAH